MRSTEVAKGILVSVVAWTAAIGLFGLVRFYGLESVEVFEDLDVASMNRGLIMAQTLAAGAVIGLVYGLMDLWFDRPKLRQLPYGRLIIAQSSVHIAILVVIMGVIRAIGFPLSGEAFQFNVWLSRVVSANMLIVLLYTGVVSVFFTFIRHVNRKFGPGNLVKLLMGKYYRPREERRIFMFLDLQSSTTIAERLGHVRYSRLIQDCFRDLAVVLQDRAEVYQYVGDEAVLCWEVEKGVENLACLAAFFRFDDQIQAHSDHYTEQYEVVPVFKAGLNIGLVTVAEVGEIKREIAFHGDTLNTAARIQSKCNELGRRLLISEYLADALGDPSPYLVEPMGNVALRGRSKSVDIFAVERASEP